MRLRALALPRNVKSGGMGDRRSACRFPACRWFDSAPGHHFIGNESRYLCSERPCAQAADFALGSILGFRGVRLDAME
jgi:hypothetical protein